VDLVVSDAKVAAGVVLGGGLGAGGVDGGRCAPAQGAVLAPVVVEVGELVEKRLEVVEGSDCWSCS
jgi:hypothetical protein